MKKNEKPQLAQNVYSAKKLLTLRYERIKHAGRLFFRMAKTLPSPPENEKLLAKNNQKL